MLFIAEVAVATDKSKTDPEVATLKIAHGIISRVSVYFPPGCSQKVHCVILHHEHQIFPSTEDMDLTGDAAAIEWNEYYESYQPPYELKIKCWGVDCSHSHTVTVRVAILPRKAIVALAIVDAVKGLFGMLMPKRISVSAEMQ